MAGVAGKPVWLVLEGVLLVVLGIAALFLPLFAGLAATLVVGWVLIFSGIVGLISAFAGHAHAHRGWSLVSAVIALVVGVLVLFNPLAGAVALALLIGAYLLLDGVALIALSLDQRKRGAAAWGWLLTAGIVDLVLAIAILVLSGFGSAVLIGIIVGVDLIAAGVALLAVHRRPRIPLAV